MEGDFYTKESTIKKIEILGFFPNQFIFIIARIVWMFINKLARLTISGKLLNDIIVINKACEKKA